jgi:hypothetical protein
MRWGSRSPALGNHANSLESKHGHSSIVPGGTSGGSPKMRWFRCFVTTKKEKQQTTSGNDQSAADQNQLRGHDDLLCQKPVGNNCLP